MGESDSRYMNEASQYLMVAVVSAVCQASRCSGQVQVGGGYSNDFIMV